VRDDGKHGGGKPEELTYEALLTLSGPQPLWTVKKLATTLGVSSDYVYAAVSKNEIPCVRIGTNIRFHYKDVVVWFNRLRTPASERR
jgi:excisionase family DNA binding protein